MVLAAWWGKILIVGLGAIIGANARVWLSNSLDLDSFPAATFIVNTSGSLLLGIVVTAVQQFQLNPHWKLFLGTGLLGSWTTFSTYSLDGWLALSQGEKWIGIVYLVASVLSGVILAALGSMVVNYFDSRRRQRAKPRIEEVDEEEEDEEEAEEMITK